MTATHVTCDGWTLEKVLGTGGFGTVQLWMHVQSGNKLAIKKCKWDKAQLTPAQEKRWAHEVKIMNELQHPNIVKSQRIPFRIPGEELPVLCMEYCRQGDLRKVLNKPENCCGIQEPEAIKAMKDISSAIEYLHCNNITHRDLKPENIVLQNENNTILYKLIDLGYAKELGEASISASIVGTLNYIAPELLWKETYNCSVDYWSLGILFYELATGKRPFLPKMQHTVEWMQHIKDKEDIEICAHESEGKVIFGKDIQTPTNLSRCLRDKLVKWFRITLRWDPRIRGKQLDETGTPRMVVFELLKSILSKKIVYVFTASLYKIDAYEVDETTTIKDLQQLIEKDTDISVSQQILTDYYGNLLKTSDTHFLSLIDEQVLFVFKNGGILLEDTPVINIPKEILNMIEQSRKHLHFDILKDYYRVTLFFIKQEVHMFQLYIFALNIKIDLMNTRINMFNESMEKALLDTNKLLTESAEIYSVLLKETLDKERKEALENNSKKVHKLVNAANQIRMNFVSLMEKNNELRNIAQYIDCVKDLSELYNIAASIYEAARKENNHTMGTSQKMAGIFTEFLEQRATKLNNKNIREIVRLIMNLEDELLKLEKSFNSVIAMTVIYREQFQKIANFDHSKQSSTDQIPNISLTSFDDATPNDNVIYESLVIRYTMENLMSEMHKSYLDIINLDP